MTATLVRNATVESAGMEAALQPIVDLATGRVVGAEALARFPDERSPDLHFAEADTKGLRIELELAAVRAALLRLSDLPAGAYLTVNVSPATAVSPLLPAVLAAVPAHRIVLELTEHAAVEDYPALEAALSSLRDRGVRIAVDDAGAGFASLRHVIALRPDVLKLDISITHGINADVRRRELVRAMVSFSRATGCTLVAEGIETEDELNAVRNLGVRCGQGFRLGRPERKATGPWQVALPPMRWRPGRARPSARATASRGPVRFRRFVRPANIVLAAAIAWPGLASVAGLKAPSPGALRAPVAESRTDSGGSPQTRITAPRPAAIKPVSAVTQTKPAAPPSATSATTAPSASEEPRRPVARTVQTLTSTVTDVVDTKLTTVETTVDTTVGTLGDVVNGLLGR